MKANLDNYVYFDDRPFELQIKSRQRQTVERGGIGLDGAVSIDMGLRKRTLIQTGLLREINKSRLNETISKINEMFDGQSRTLMTSDGRVFENIRIDSFEIGTVAVAGTSVSCSYKIIYTQLG